MENRYLLEAERKIRLTAEKREQLYYLLLSESGLREKLNECASRLTTFCEKLTWKYVLGEEISLIYPGCLRISKQTKYINLFFKEDFDIDVPKFKKEDLIENIEDTFMVSLSKPIPAILNEGSIWRRKDIDFVNDFRFATIIKKSAKDIEIKTLINLIYELISVNVEFNSFLCELRAPSRAAYKSFEEFGKFFNLGSLYDYNKELAFRMKYEILLLEDLEDVKESNQLFDKTPTELSADQNTERLKYILYAQ